MSYDVVIVGGGPAGLSGALALGRARKRVLLCDAGARRNALAVHMHNFVTRDGITPEAFRRAGREQLTAYPNVVVRDDHVTSISGAKGAFRIVAGKDTIDARRVLLCAGMVDEMMPLDGFAELWGHAIFQCPYCHGWEVKDRPWGVLARPENAAHISMFAVLLRGWTRDVCLFTGGEVELSDDVRRQLESAGVRVETGRIERLVRADRRLEAVELAGGLRIACEVLFAHPPQRQVELVRTLGLTLDTEGFVQVDPMSRETSIPGVFASGDLTSRMQAAIAAAATGMQAAAMINAQLTMELAAKGEI